jgi:hypothetical protein
LAGSLLQSWTKAVSLLALQLLAMLCGLIMCDETVQDGAHSTASGGVYCIASADALGFDAALLLLLFCGGLSACNLRTGARHWDWLIT